jgi:hypothetical protein
MVLVMAIGAGGLSVSSAPAASPIASPEACAEVKQFMAQGGFRMPAQVSAEDRAVAEKARRMADENGSAAPDAAGQALLKGMNMNPAAKAVAKTAGKPGITRKDVMAEMMKQLGC